MLVNYTMCNVRLKVYLFHPSLSDNPLLNLRDNEIQGLLDTLFKKQ